jgi:hypothetical protein
MRRHAAGKDFSGGQDVQVRPGRKAEHLRVARKGAPILFHAALLAGGSQLLTGWISMVLPFNPTQLLLRSFFARRALEAEGRHDRVAYHNRVEAP